MADEDIIHPSYELPYKTYRGNLIGLAEGGLEGKVPNGLPARVQLAERLYENAREKEQLREFPSSFVLYTRMVKLWVSHIGRGVDAGLSKKAADAMTRADAIAEGPLERAWEREMVRVRKAEAAAREEAERRRKAQEEAAAAEAAREEYKRREATEQARLAQERQRAQMASLKASEREAAVVAQRREGEQRLDALSKATARSREAVAADAAAASQSDSTTSRLEALERRRKEEQLRALEAKRRELAGGADAAGGAAAGWSLASGGAGGGYGVQPTLDPTRDPPMGYPSRPAAGPPSSIAGGGGNVASTATIVPPAVHQWSFTPGRDPPPRGLRNLGNTCYMNSTLQALAASTDFVSHLLRGRHRGAGAPEPKDASASAVLDSLATKPYSNPISSRGVVTRALLQTLQAQLFAGNAGIAYEPRALKEAVGGFNSDFRGVEQQDAHEFVRVLLDAVHEDLNRAAYRRKEPRPADPDSDAPDEAQYRQAWAQYFHGNVSHVTAHFAFIERSVVRCSACPRGVSKTFTPVMSLDVQIPRSTGSVAGVPGAVSLYDCLKRYTQEERLDGTWTCPSCSQSVRPYKRMSLLSKPPYLVVSLKRFGMSGFGGGLGGGFGGGATQKVTTPVVFPSELDLAPFLVPEGRGFGTRYALYAVVNHMGTLHSGHYTVDVKVGGGWYSISDERASPASGSPKWADAYILFYRQIEA